MSEASRSRVTITLGRSGQVVKKAGPAVDVTSFSDSRSSIGTKRSMRDRLGNIVDSTGPFNSKRQRLESGRLSLCATNDMDDVTLTKDDLRFKIMHKSERDNQHFGMDLREVLSRPAQSSTTTIGTRRHRHEQKDTRQQLLESRASRQLMPEPRNASQPIPGPRNSGQLMPEPRSTRQLMNEPQVSRYHQPGPRESRHLMPEIEDGRHLRPASNVSSIMGQFPSTRSTDALPPMDSSRNSYSPWTLDSLRRRSPNRYQLISRDLSPPRRYDEQERRPLVKAYDDSRTNSYMRNDAFEHSHPITSANYNDKTAQTVGPARSLPPHLPPLPVSVSHVQKTSHTVDDHSTVDSFLHSLGLDKFIINFKAEEVDMYALRQMDDSDLKDLGIPMGPRKKILVTLRSRLKRQP